MENRFGRFSLACLFAEGDGERSDREEEVKFTSVKESQVNPAARPISLVQASSDKSPAHTPPRPERPKIWPDLRQDFRKAA